jgi:serine/threonine protein kinase
MSVYHGAVPPTDFNLNRISLEYSYIEIVKATSNFSNTNLLGSGAYGSVYKGILKDGTEVAIKKLFNPKQGGFKEEVEVLSKHRHPNLVILMGFARNQSERFLVYEFLKGGDLSVNLSTSTRSSNPVEFDHKKRINVAVDAALGLSHLHNSNPRVFHRDVKSMNILLDRNGSGRIADFGLALLANPANSLKGKQIVAQSSILVKECAGTAGYADPHYISSSVMNEKREVYSFGMVLLEILTSLPPATVDGKDQIQYTYKDKDFKAIMGMVQWDAKWPKEIAQFLAQLALACIQESEDHRPLFVDIVNKLRKLQSHISAAPTPPPPAMVETPSSSKPAVPSVPRVPPPRSASKPLPDEVTVPAPPVVAVQKLPEQLTAISEESSQKPSTGSNPFIKTEDDIDAILDKLFGKKTT